MVLKLAVSKEPAVTDWVVHDLAVASYIERSEGLEESAFKT